MTVVPEGSVWKHVGAHASETYLVTRVDGEDVYGIVLLEGDAVSSLRKEILVTRDRKNIARLPSRWKRLA